MEKTPLKCPLIDEKWHKEAIYVFMGGIKCIGAKVVRSFPADVFEPADRESSLSAVEKDPLKCGCVERKTCPIYEKLVEEKEHGNI